METEVLEAECVAYNMILLLEKATKSLEKEEGVEYLTPPESVKCSRIKAYESGREEK